MNLISKEIVFEDYTEVVDMLQKISNFIPDHKLHKSIFNKFLRQTNQHSVATYIEDEIIAYGMIVFEFKIRGGIVGHIEDIVVKDKYQGKGIGKKLISELIELGRNKKCYKYSLSCSKENIGFYESCGFKVNGINMGFLDL